MGPRRRLIALVVAISAVALIAGPVSATQWTEVFKESGTSAFADDFDCVDNGDGTTTCSGTFVNAFEGKIKALSTKALHEERICYQTFVETYDTDTGEFLGASAVFGCAFDTGTVSVDRLDSVTIAATTIEVIAISCDAGFECTEAPGGDVVVAGSWTGVGGIASSKSKFRFDDGLCVQMEASKGAFREAIFSGTADGNAISASFAEIGQGMFTFRTSCSFE